MVTIVSPVRKRFAACAGAGHHRRLLGAGASGHVYRREERGGP